jgi:hypothetical protein
MRIGVSLVAAQQRFRTSLDAAHAAAALSTLGPLAPQGVDCPSDDRAEVLPVQALARDQAAVQAGILRAHKAAGVAAVVPEVHPGEN